MKTEYKADKKYRVYFCGQEIPVSEEMNRNLREAWDIHSMKAHDADGRELEYIGYSFYCKTDGRNQIICWYRDEDGEYWYETRVLVDGKIVSNFVYWFGEEKNRPEIKNARMVPTAYES